MIYYKDNENIVFAFEEDGTQSHLVTDSMREISLKEAKSSHFIKKTTISDEIKESIASLERSIDTSRIRREFGGYLRNRLNGAVPTADELWAVKKVQEVDSKIESLRNKL